MVRITKGNRLLSSRPSIVYNLTHAKTRRVTAVGCECGLVKVAIVNVVDLQVSRSWLLRYDKPVPSVIVFPHRNTISKPAFMDTNCKYVRCIIYVCNAHNLR